MLTLKQIIKRTRPDRIMNARFVKITKLKTGYSRSGRAYAACQSYSTHHITPEGRLVPHKDHTRYVTVIEFLDARLRVNVSCSCDDFKYRAEYALHTHGAADIEYSNGEAATTTNPNNTPQCCKHLVSLYNRIKHKLPE